MKEKTFKKILVFELNWMGDILFSFPFLRALRENFPEAYIQCVVVPRYAEMLAANPWVNDVHYLSDNNKITSIKEKIEFVRMIRKEEYDACFMLKPSSTKTIMAVMAGIKNRIGFIGKNDMLTDAVKMPTGEVHRADQILSLASIFGAEKTDGTYEFHTRREDQEKADDFLKERCGLPQKIIVINPGGNWDAKRWPSEKYIKLSKKFLADFADICIVVTGAEKDIDLSKNIVSKIGSERCISIAGSTGLNMLAAIFRRAMLVVSADSGPLHLASATGTTTIGLFGPTSSKITGPRGQGKNVIISKEVDCEIPCYVEMCIKDFACMNLITVDEVYEQARKVLAEDVG